MIKILEEIWFQQNLTECSMTVKAECAVKSPK